MVAENKYGFCLTRMRQLRIHHIYKGPFLGLFSPRLTICFCFKENSFVNQTTELQKDCRICVMTPGNGAKWILPPCDSVSRCSLWTETVLLNLKCTFFFLIKIMKYLKYNVLQQSEYLQNTDSFMMRCLNNSFVAVNYKALSLHTQLLPYFTHSSGSENCPLFIPYKVFLFSTALFWQDSVWDGRNMMEASL